MQVKLSIVEINGIPDGPIQFTASVLDKHVLLQEQGAQIIISEEDLLVVFNEQNSLFKHNKTDLNTLVTVLINQRIYIDLIMQQTIAQKKTQEIVFTPIDSQYIDLLVFFKNPQQQRVTNVNLQFSQNISLILQIDFQSTITINNIATFSLTAMNFLSMPTCSWACDLVVDNDVYRFQQFEVETNEKLDINKLQLQQRTQLSINDIQAYSELQNTNNFSFFESHQQLANYTCNAIQAFDLGTSEAFELFYISNRPLNQIYCIPNLSNQVNFDNIHAIFYPKFNLLKKLQMLSQPECSKFKQLKDSPVPLETIGPVNNTKINDFTRAQLYQTSLMDAPFDIDLMEYALVFELSGAEIKDPTKKNYLLNVLDFPCPLDLKIHAIPLKIEKLTAQPTDTKPSKGKTTEAVYSDNSPNYTLRNRLVGANFLVEQLQKTAIEGLSCVGKDNEFVRKLLAGYGANCENQNTAKTLIKQLLKLNFIVVLGAGTSPPHIPSTRFLASAQKPISLVGDFSRKLAGNAPVLTPKSAPLAFHAIELKPSAQLKKHMISLLQSLAERYVLAQKPTSSMLQSLSCKEALEVDRIVRRKQLALRGIQGKFTQETAKARLEIQDQLSMGEFQEIVQGEGFLESIVRIIEPQILDLAQQGFSSLKGLIAEIQIILEHQVSKLNSFASKIKPIAHFAQIKPTGLKSPQILSNISSQVEIDSLASSQQDELVMENQDTRVILGPQLNQIIQLISTYDAQYMEYSFQALISILAKNPISAFSCKDFRLFIQLLVYCGFLMSQPHEIQAVEDQSRINQYLKQPTSIVITMNSTPEFQAFIPSSVAMLSLAWIKTERFLTILADQKDKFVNCSGEITDEEDKPLTANMTTSSQREKRLGEFVQEQTQQNKCCEVNEHESLQLLKNIIEDDDDFSLNIIYNGLLVKKNVWKSTDSKMDILSKLQSYKYTKQDISSILENMGFPYFQMTQHERFNLICYSDLVIYNDEAGKRRQMTIYEANNKDIDLRLNKPGIWIIMSFLYILWKKNLISVKQIDISIQNAVNKLYQTHQMEFRGILQDLIDKQEEDRFIASSQSSYRAGTACNQKQTQQAPTYVNLLPKVQSIQQGIDTKKPMEKHVSYNQLMAIQEHICQQMPQIQHILPTRIAFTTDEEYMDYLLNKCIPGDKLNIEDQDRIYYSKATALINLSEWLCLRGEQTISKMAYEEAQVFIQQIKTDYSFVQTMHQRVHLVVIRQLFFSKNYNSVIEYTDLVKQQGGILYQKMKNSPQYNLLRSKSFLEAYVQKRNGENVKIYNTFVDILALLEEINKNTFQAYYAQNKSKGDFDDFNKGSTNIGEIGFFDASFGYGLMTCFISCVGITDHIKQIYLPIDFINIRKVKKDQLPMTATAFLQDQSIANDRNSQETLINMINSGEFDVLDSVQQSARTEVEASKKKQKKINLKTNQDYNVSVTVDEFQAMRKQIIQNQQEGLVRDSPTRQQQLVSKQQSLVSQHTNIKQAEQVQDQLKETYKQIQSAAMACKSFLDNWSGFGPAWALYSIIQLAMGNVSEARMSSSLSTLLSPQVPETWIAWSACELFNALNVNGSYDVIMDVYKQISAMGVTKSKAIDIWEEVVRLVESQKQKNNK
ncbi:hypothetical protein SS50377_20352 [Spironucleus salmonicida]|uniref:Uncharacterized protein n=1 Tax=Spironucleus salmonicida TaxID=348837 RepID=V6LFG1_9EUKA|nr:hypothetical protein SS50377_20352 [Spironucleus salmonicida]|eukprot:EST43033.1 hypothetical protein SS50377_17335 [Spironucleus salmonicida]